MDRDNARLVSLLNYMESRVLKKYLNDVCSCDEYRNAIYDLPYLNPKEGSMFVHVLDVGCIAKSIWDIKADALNYDYLMVGALLHEYKLFDVDLVEKFKTYLQNHDICDNAVNMLTNIVTAVNSDEESVLTVKTVEAVILRYAKKSADVIAVCDNASSVKDGQMYFVDYPKVPYFSKPITVK